MSGRRVAGSLFIGLMSGTSLDGVDAVLVDLTDAPRIAASAHLAFSPALKSSLLALHETGPNEIDRAALLANELADCYARSVARLLEHAPRARVAAIGCHGQTVRHRPERGYTVQIVNAARLAESSGITVVADFRSRDVAAGGQGAPLVPAFHAHCFRDAARHRVIVNIGGIANLTDLPPAGRGRVSGFDTGPGNLLLDTWARRHLGSDFDRDGRLAASGTCQADLLERMLADEFFRRTPPRSTGRDHFGPAWLDSFEVRGTAPADVQATLAELSARSIADAIAAHCPGGEEIYVCGGGSHNRDLMARLARCAGARRLDTTAALGIAPEQVEAAAFAWLAQRTLAREPGNVPEVTGARGARVLGAVHYA